MKSKFPYYISVTYEPVSGKIWTGDIEVVFADNPQEAVEDALLVWRNITLNGRIDGDIQANIYSDAARTVLLDTLKWSKISKDNFTYIKPEDKP